MMLMHSASKRSVFFVVLVIATTSSGCSSSEESTREPSSDIAMPRRQAPAPAAPNAAPTEPATPAAVEASEGSHTVWTFAPPPAAPQCATDGDCRAFSDSCGGCNCRPLGAKESDPKCAGEEAACFADPCGGKVAACDLGTHVCVVK